MKIKLVRLEWNKFADGWPNLGLSPHDVHKMQDPLASVCFLGIVSFVWNVVKYFRSS